MRTEWLARVPRRQIRLQWAGFVTGGILMIAGFGQSFWRWLGDTHNAIPFNYVAGPIFVAAGMFLSYRFLRAIVRTYVEAMPDLRVRALEG